MSAVCMQSKTFWWYKYEGISPMRHLQVWAAFWPRLRWDCPPNIKRFIVENHSYVAKLTIPRLDRETLAVTNLGHLANLSIQHLLVCFVSPEFGQVFTLGSTPILSRPLGFLVITSDTIIQVLSMFSFSSCTWCFWRWGALATALALTALATAIAWFFLCLGLWCYASTTFASAFAFDTFSLLLILWFWFPSWFCWRLLLCFLPHVGSKSCLPFSNWLLSMNQNWPFS